MTHLLQRHGTRRSNEQVFCLVEYQWKSGRKIVGRATRGALKEERHERKQQGGKLITAEDPGLWLMPL